MSWHDTVPEPADRGDPRRRFRRCLWEQSLLRWESATVLALALAGGALAAVGARHGLVPGWSWLALLLLCLAGECALLLASLRDPESHRRATSRLLLGAFRPHRLADAGLRQRVLQAFDIRARTAALLRSDQGLRGAPAAAAIAAQLDGWIGVLCGLAARLARIKAEPGFSAAQARDSQARAQLLQAAAAAEVDPATRRALAATIAGHEALLGHLRQVDKAVARADLLVEQSVSQLGAIFARIVLLGAQGLESERAMGLGDEIAAEIAHLTAMSAAIEGLQPPGYGSSSPSPA